jgi:hypothetical protein
MLLTVTLSLLPDTGETPGWYSVPARRGAARPERRCRHRAGLFPCPRRPPGHTRQPNRPPVPSGQVCPGTTMDCQSAVMPWSAGPAARTTGHGTLPSVNNCLRPLEAAQRAVRHRRRHGPRPAARPGRVHKHRAPPAAAGHGRPSGHSYIPHRSARRHQSGHRAAGRFSRDERSRTPRDRSALARSPAGACGSDGRCLIRNAPCRCFDRRWIWEAFV